MDLNREVLIKMNESIISLLEQIQLFRQDEKRYQAQEAQKFFDRITYYTSIQV